MLPPILARKKAMAYPVFDGQYDLNIVGVRKRNGAPNKFDDMLTCTYRQGGQWMSHYWTATTDPGQYYLLNPLQVKALPFCAQVTTEGFGRLIPMLASMKHCASAVEK